jgi:hypothetical protein
MRVEWHEEVLAPRQGGCWQRMDRNWGVSLDWYICWPLESHLNLSIRLNTSRKLILVLVDQKLNLLRIIIDKLLLLVISLDHGAMIHRRLGRIILFLLENGHYVTNIRGILIPDYFFLVCIFSERTMHKILDAFLVGDSRRITTLVVQIDGALLLVPLAEFGLIRYAWSLSVVIFWVWIRIVVARARLRLNWLQIPCAIPNLCLVNSIYVPEQLFLALVPEIFFALFPIDVHAYPL